MNSKSVNSQLNILRKKNGEEKYIAKKIEVTKEIFVFTTSEAVEFLKNTSSEDSEFKLGNEVIKKETLRRMLNDFSEPSTSVKEASAVNGIVAIDKGNDGCIQKY
jgi:hypothetical protein